MLNSLRTSALLSLFACFLSGCALAPAGEAEPGDGELGAAAGALEDENALNMNALNMNALNMNALNMNALNMNALDPAALSSLQDPGATGALARQLLKYTVGCAFDPTQSLSLSWTDSSSAVHAETYSGLLGLAPTWKTQPLTEDGERWISACLASRVNWYGVPVQLSSRGSAPSLANIEASELASYPKSEGAFWGNLFAQKPYVYSCNHALNNDHSRSLKRDCAAGHVEVKGVIDCGMIHVAGSCDDLCSALDPAGSYYPHCGTAPLASDATDKVITVFLQ